MSDNGEWETAKPKSVKKREERNKAEAALKRNEEIKELHKKLSILYNELTPKNYNKISEDIKRLKNLGVANKSVSHYEYLKEQSQREEKVRAAKAVKLAKNKAKVNSYYGPKLQNEYDRAKKGLYRSFFGQKIQATNEEIYNYLSTKVNKEIAEEQAKEANEEESENNTGYYSYSYDPTNRRYGAPRQTWQDRAARGEYQEWIPSYASAPAIYTMLELPVTASENEIRSAYRKKALIHHPNKGGDEEKFKELQKEYLTALAALGIKGGRRRTKRSKRKYKKTLKNQL